MQPERSTHVTKIDDDLVESLVAEQFPRWRGLPVAQVLPGGWDSRTFRLGDDLSLPEI
jgi:aminoglycoside phosphotransferase (APT) family kinase protein